MDGTYGNVFPSSRAMSPGAPAPSGGNQYKVNVSRQKTKKWANFKPQNYDGDDWGDEYDDEPDEQDEPEPPVPSKPMGPRHPAANSPTARQFQPPGSPPLRIFPQQHPGPASAMTPSPSSTPGGPPRRTTEPFGSSPHNIAGHARPQFPHDARRGSPAPQSAHALPSQLPPRNRSTGPDDVADPLVAMRQSGPSPRPSGSPKPEMDTRSTSPPSAGPMASPDKPLPLVRPADVYQQMKEERKRERRSLETGRPGADAGDPAGLNTQLQRGPPTQPAESPAAEDASAGRALRSTGGLPPVVEGQVGHGFDGLPARYGTEGPSAGSPAAHQVKSAEPPKSVQPVSHEDIRRYSRSPQLPDLSRLSGFGEDLFSSSSFFPASGLRSPISGSMQLPTSGQCIPEEGPGELATPQSVASNTATTAGVGADAVPSPPNEPDQDRPVGLSLHQGAAEPVLNAPGQQAPAADAAREPASGAEERPATLATRPHLPGGWVSETPSTPAEVVASSSPAGRITEPEDKAAESRGALASITQPEQGGTSEADTAKDRSPVPSHPTSPHAVPPPPTSSQALRTNSAMSSRQATPEAAGRNAPPSPGSQTAESSSAMPVSTATEHTEITPTAPLNPRRGTPDSNTSTQLVMSPPFPAETALDTPAHSPVKDSDMLSEEIIKSLSPAPPAGGFADAVEGSTAAYQAAAAEPTRESSYLGDVYGDYWATTEDKAEPGLLLVGKGIGAEKVALDIPPLPTKALGENATKGADAVGSSSPSTPSHATPAEASGSQPKSASGDGGLQRRFSWEATPKAATPAAASSPAAALPSATEHLVEQKALGLGAENVGRSPAKVSTPEAVSLPSSPAQEEGGKSAEDLRAESAPEFNPAGTPDPTPAFVRPPLPSPSPVSASTDRLDDAKRMSLAEEKIVLQHSSHPSASSPPLEQHPVFAAAESRQPRRAAEPGPSGWGAPSPKSIVGFRNIMEMPLPTERIKLYNEARWQFSAVDTGLDDWLRAMVSLHPEHASDVLAYPGGAALHTQPSGQGGAAAAQTAGHGLGLGQGGGRGPTLHIPPQLQHGLSGLGHSSGQVGTKSKELLMAAGKAGKGLFSKGRNKLRGTG
ncbi:hypothetical protein C8A01DRAFT_17267 [Parachaetomium inaequale]|uniref:Uncharacterized protein n=1 Tax=Parachaetomium inaequale TaxID=2588326 RepID=A0AAN6PDM1_9PEZI|nr:hypothetical protein C8A01DRAFT_17267 [Parachaetomium inaequale]